MDKIEFKAAFTIDDTGAIAGIAWPFNAADRTGDVIEPKAFISAIGKSIPMLAGHDKPVGIWNSISTDSEGLKVSGRLLVDDVPEAKATRALIKAGAVTGLSIGFMTKKALPRKGGGRTISDLDLVEVSIVAVPAHAGARITSAKELPLDNEEQGAAPEIAALETKIDAIADSVKSLNLSPIEKRLAELEKKANRPNIASADDAAKQLAAEEQKAFVNYLRRGDKAIAEEDRKALTVSDDPQGGYLAPAEMSGEFIRNLVLYSPIRSIASVRSTVAPSVKYPKRNSITNAQWEGEIDDQPESTLTFGQAEIVVRQVTTYVDISNQLFADSAGEVETEVTLALSQDFGQKEAVAFVNGDGVLQPEGFMTNANVDFTVSGDAAKVTADALIALMYALPAPYRNAGEWVLNGTTLGAIRQLKDAQGRYVWQPGLTLGQPETILGRPVVEAVDMPDVAANAFPIAFGDFGTAYRIIDRLSLSVLPDPYALAIKGITRIHATRRVGGGVLVPAAIRKLKISA